MAKFKIKETQIDNYNETNNQFHEFDESLNIICGQNEAGKSTMMEFIKNIFINKSSGKGYIKCELDGNEFKLIAGGKKETKENEQYLSQLNPHEFQTGFIINLDDIMCAQNADEEKLINTIKDLSGNAINQKQNEYYEYIYTDKKQSFCLTPKKLFSKKFEKQFQKLKDLDAQIKDLQAKEEDYNNVITEIDTINKKIDNLSKKIKFNKILIGKNNLTKEKEDIKLNEKLISNKSDFDNIREEFGVLKSLQNKTDIIKNEIKENNETLETKIKLLSKLDILASENIENIETNPENLKSGRALIEKAKKIEADKTNTLEKIREKELKVSELESYINLLKTQTEALGIKDYENYRKDKGLLEGYECRYSELNDKSNNTNYTSFKPKGNNINLLIYGAMLCASISLLISFGQNSVRIPIIILIIASVIGLAADFIQKLGVNNSNNAYSEESDNIKTEIIKLCSKYGYEFSHTDNFIVKIRTFLQEMDKICSKYEDYDNNLNKEIQELDELKTNLETIKDMSEKFNAEEQEFLDNIKFSSLNNFDEIFEQIREIKSLDKKIKDQTEELKNIDNQSENFVNKLNKFISDTELKGHPKYNKYDDIEAAIKKISEILSENIINNTKLSELEEKIKIYENELREYPSDLSETESDNILEELETELQEKTDERGRLRQKKSDLEQVSNLINLRNEKKAELNKIKSALSKLIQKELVYNLIIKAKEEFNKTQPNLICAKKYFSKITGDKYSDIDFENKTISGKNLGDKEWNNLSRGTKEQLYLALRLGYANNFSKDIKGNPNGKPNLPIIIDDAFVNFDTSRTTAIIKCLSEFSENNQVLYFTCHTKEVEEILKENKIKHNLINI